MRPKFIIVGVCMILIAGLSLGQTWDFNKRLTYSLGNSEDMSNVC